MREIVSRIAEAISEDKLNRADDFSLAGGISGISIFLAQFSKYSACEESLRKLDLIGDRLAQLLDSNIPLSMGFFSGLPGIAYAYETSVKIAQPHIYDPSINDDTDEIIFDYLCNRHGIAHFDLVSGLVGLGQYAMSRPRTELTQQIFGLVLELLSARSCSENGGLTWITYPSHFGTEASAERHPLGVRNLGIAHGVPGVILMLASALLSGYSHPIIKPMLNDACRWLMSMENIAGTSYSYIAEQEVTLARTAWCYGDAGVALALVKAGVALRQSPVLDAGLRAGRRAAKRDAKEAKVTDNSLCHGAAGLATIFGTLNELFPDEQFQSSKGRWLNAIEKEYLTGGTHEHDNDRQSWKGDLSILTGATGVGLVLLDELLPNAAKWSAWLNA